jgi:hypothetical protein
MKKYSNKKGAPEVGAIFQKVNYGYLEYHIKYVEKNSFSKIALALRKARSSI